MSAHGGDVPVDGRIAAPLDPHDPRRIGSFRLLGVLGSGGMGRVYLGVADSGFVAVKQVLPSVAVGSGFLPRFRHEVETLYRLPAGVGPRVLAHDGTATPPWFATEYVPGVTVAEAVEAGGPLPRAALWRLLTATAAHLRTVHEAGIIHRDLKPGNVLLTADGVALIDFGIAWAAGRGRLTRDGAGSGTPGFAAPEQDTGGAPVTAAADIYALGALLLHAATDRMPAADPDLAPLRTLDNALASVIEPCLAHDPSARPTAADLLATIRAHTVDHADDDPTTPWPTTVETLLSQREALAATPLTKLPTVPPPTDTPPDEPPPAPPLAPPHEPPFEPPQDPRHEPPAVRARRRRRLLLPIAALVAAALIGGAAALTTVLLLPTPASPQAAQHEEPHNASSGPTTHTPTATAPPAPTGPTTPAPTTTSLPPAPPGDPGDRPALAGSATTSAAAPAPGAAHGAPPAAANPSVPTAPTLFRNSVNGQCLTDYGAYLDATTTACTQTATNAWTRQPVADGVFELVNKASGACLTEESAYGGLLSANPCTGAPGQRWTAGPSSASAATLRSHESGQCAAVVSSGVMMASCTDPGALWTAAGTL